MGFREPAIYYQQATRPGPTSRPSSATTARSWTAYGRQPGGMFGADENIRPGKNDPRQGAETCSMVEFMASFESLLRITGDTVWADRCRGGRLQFPARFHDPRPQGPPLSDRGQPRLLRQLRRARLPEQRDARLVRPSELSLLPAQRRFRLAVFRRAPLDGHGGQRPGRRRSTPRPSVRAKVAEGRRWPYRRKRPIPSRTRCG